MNPGRIFLPLPAIPANNETIVLWASRNKIPTGGTALHSPALGKQGDAPKRVDMVTIVFLQHNKASALNGLRVYGWDALDDTGTWKESDLKDDFGAASCGVANPIQVPALVAGQEFRRSLFVGHLFDKAIEYTAGADNPENWAGYIVLELAAAAVVR